MKDVGHFLCIGYMRNAHQIVIGYPEGQDDLGAGSSRVFGIMILK
jgi:hypothetical protein